MAADAAFKPMGKRKKTLVSSIVYKNNCNLLQTYFSFYDVEPIFQPAVLGSKQSTQKLKSNARLK